MSLDRRKQSGRRAGWAWAIFGSFWLHAFALGVLVGTGGRGLRGASEAIAVDLIAPPLALPALMPEIQRAASSAEPLPDPPPATHDEVTVARPLDAPEGDRDDAALHTLAPREADGRARATPAPDQGQSEEGRRPQHAFRRDRSVLHAQLTDGSAAATQPAHSRTSDHASSPQAIRRETATGVGDSIATTEPARTPSAAHPDSPPVPAGDESGASGSRLAPLAVRPLEVPRVAEHASDLRGVGPLAVESGARAFDVDRRGRAADDQALRAASNERHPGITDFSRPAVAGPRESGEGRGPARAPGAVPVMTSGSAPADMGARNPDQETTVIVERMQEREYDRYLLEVQRRVQRVLVFPKVLALHLEQGETVVSFAVRADGLVGEAPRIVKSSGFQEFDAEAVKAVLRAAPYPRRPDAHRGLLTVTFENPLIR